MLITARKNIPVMPLKLRLVMGFVLVALVAGLVFMLLAALGFARGWALAGSFAVTVAVAVACGLYLSKPLLQQLKALEIGLLNFKDNEFGVSITSARQDELYRLTQLFNETSESLRKSRQHIYQRELLLDKLVQSSPQAMVLTDANDRIIYSNAPARALFHQGKPLEGGLFFERLAAMPESLRQAVSSRQDGLFSFIECGENQTYHLSQGQFTLNAQVHRLHIFKQLTRELNRQEAAIWKKVIRLVSHELNNSIAPISSMAHSARLILDSHSPNNHPDPRLLNIVDTIGTRAKRINNFIQGYAQYAKLPAPNKEAVDWNTFIGALREQIGFEPLDPLPQEQACFDPAQIEQVLINLLKNALESGSDPSEIKLQVERQGDYFQINVTDRGKGVPQLVLENALLPFYSTKPSGTGLGLALSREIVEAHQGRIALQNRTGGGLCASFWLPAVS